MDLTSGVVSLKSGDIAFYEQYLGDDDVASICGGNGNGMGVWQTLSILLINC